MPLWFDYDLPPALIAQHPVAERDAARLLVLHRTDGRLSHRTFRDLPELLQPGDLLILNDTRVLPARLIGRRESTGGRWEGLFLRVTESGLWEMLAQTRGYPREGESFAVEPGPLRLTLRRRTSDRHWLMEPDPPGRPDEILPQHGRLPLPPYIRKGEAADEDRERYQTVFAQRPGAVAAPTAGLHFTEPLLEQLRARGIGTARVTLHVGLGTFEPVREEDPTHHQMHSEWCEVPAATVEAIRACRGRVIAVGTTTVRTLESAARDGELRAWSGETDLFIHPPYEFRVVQGMITNFHLPRTTLLLLVGAFAGVENLRRAYEEAIEREYRFYSYGDAMLIV